MSGLWQTGKRNYPENSKEKLVQEAGIKLSQLNFGGIPSCNASVLTAHLGFPLSGNDSLQDPQLTLFPPGSPHGHSGCSLPFVILLPTLAGRLEGKSAFMLPSCTPAPPSWCPGHLPACDQLSPRNICFLFFLLRPPEASFFMNKIWAVLLEPWREETTASAFYCCGCWCLWPHWQEQRREERAQGFSPVTLCSVSCAVWSQYWGTADFVKPYFKQFVTKELKHFSLNWNFLLSFSQNMANARFSVSSPPFF